MSLSLTRLAAVLSTAACLLPVPVTFSLGGDAKVRGLDVEGLGTLQRVPERPR